MSFKVEDWEKDPEEVRYTIIPTLVIIGADNYIRFMIEWLNWGIGFSIERRFEEDD